MLEYFIGSYIVTIVGLIGAYLWGEHVHSGTGLACVFIAECRLGILAQQQNIHSRSCHRGLRCAIQSFIFLYPSLKFLSSHNSLRNFFSPSRGESKMFRLT